MVSLACPRHALSTNNRFSIDPLNIYGENRDFSFYWLVILTVPQVEALAAAVGKHSYTQYTDCFNLVPHLFKIAGMLYIPGRGRIICRRHNCNPCSSQRNIKSILRVIVRERCVVTCSFLSRFC